MGFFLATFWLDYGSIMECSQYVAKKTASTFPWYKSKDGLYQSHVEATFLATFDNIAKKPNKNIQMEYTNEHKTQDIFIRNTQHIG